MSESTEIVCIIDKSGSMCYIRDDTIGSFNTFLADQKDVPGEATLSVILFDDTHTILYDGVDIQDVEPLTTQTYIPGGSTALLDAIGTALTNVRGRGSKDALFVILTDGQENASREYTKDTINTMIAEDQEAGHKFLFLAANQDAIQAGGSLGIQPDDTISFSATSAGVSGVICELSRRTASYRGTVGSI